MGFCAGVKWFLVLLIPLSSASPCGQPPSSCVDDFAWVRCRISNSLSAVLQEKPIVSHAEGCSRFADRGLCATHPTEFGALCCRTFHQVCLGGPSRMDDMITVLVDSNQPSSSPTGEPSSETRPDGDPSEHTTVLSFDDETISEDIAGEQLQKTAAAENADESPPIESNSEPTMEPPTRKPELLTLGPLAAKYNWEMEESVCKYISALELFGQDVYAVLEESENSSISGTEAHNGLGNPEDGGALAALTNLANNPEEWTTDGVVDVLLRVYAIMAPVVDETSTPAVIQRIESNLIHLSEKLHKKLSHECDGCLDPLLEKLLHTLHNSPPAHSPPSKLHPYGDWSLSELKAEVDDCVKRFIAQMRDLHEEDPANQVDELLWHVWSASEESFMASDTFGNMTLLTQFVADAIANIHFYGSDMADDALTIWTDVLHCGEAPSLREEVRLSMSPAGTSVVVAEGDPPLLIGLRNALLRYQALKEQSNTAITAAAAEEEEEEESSVAEAESTTSSELAVSELAVSEAVESPDEPEEAEKAEKRAAANLQDSISTTQSPDVADEDDEEETEDDFLPLRERETEPFDGGSYFGDAQQHLMSHHYATPFPAHTGDIAAPGFEPLDRRRGPASLGAGPVDPSQYYRRVLRPLIAEDSTAAEEKQFNFLPVLMPAGERDECADAPEALVALLHGQYVKRSENCSGLLDAVGCFPIPFFIPLEVLVRGCPVSWSRRCDRHLSSDYDGARLLLPSDCFVREKLEEEQRHLALEEGLGKSLDGAAGSLFLWHFSAAFTCVLTLALFV